MDPSVRGPGRTMSKSPTVQAETEEQNRRAVQKTIGEWRVFTPYFCVCGEEFEFGGWHCAQPLDAPEHQAVVSGMAKVGTTHCAHCGTTWRIRPFLKEEEWGEFPKLMMDDRYVGPTREFFIQHGVSKRDNSELWEDFLKEHHPDLA